MLRPLPRFWMLIVLFFLGLGQLGRADTPPPKLGNIHPALVLWSIQGDEAISIDSFRGSKVLVVYFSTWSPESRERVLQWQEKTKSLVAGNELVVLGVMLEQHRDRCRLFAQWKGLEIPVLHDPLNVAGIERLPMVVAVDEYGIVRSVNPDPEGFAQHFVENKFAENENVTRTPVLTMPSPKYTARMAGEARSAKGWREHGDALVLAGLPPQINEAILTYPRVFKLEPKDVESRFRLGVAYRVRHDSPGRQPGDFQAAIDSWQEAVRLAPRNEVYRSRIQQYGIPQEKPGSMYGWITTARKELRAGGQTPVELAVEPAPVELAEPLKKFAGSKEAGSAEDGSTARSAEGYVSFESVVVRGIRSKSKRYAQVLLLFRPTNGQWHNGAEPLRVWIDPPDSVRVSRRFIEYPSPQSASSGEERVLDFEVKLSKKAMEQTLSIPGYAIFQTTKGGKPQRLKHEFKVKLKSD